MNSLTRQSLWYIYNKCGSREIMKTEFMKTPAERTWQPPYQRARSSLEYQTTEYAMAEPAGGVCEIVNPNLYMTLRNRGRGRGNLRLQLLSRLPSQHIQNDRVGNQLHIIGVFLQSSRQRSLGLRDPSQVQFRNSLANNRHSSSGTRGGCKFFVDVESGLVLFAALYGVNYG